MREDEDPKLIVDKIVPIEELSDTPQMLYIKLNSTQEEKLREVLEVLKENSGGSKVCIYFEDMRKKTYPKGIHGVKISENVLDKLRNLAGNENIALN